MSEPWEPNLSASTSSAEDSLARTSASLALERASTAHGQVSGASMPDSLASYDPATSLWRTSQHCFLGGSDVFSATWPRAGMTRSGIAYPHRPLAPLTGETGSGSWPTPSVPNGGRSPKGGMSRTGMTPDGKKRQVGLDQAVRWPTPTGQDAHNNGVSSRSERNTPPLNAVVCGALNPTWVEWLMGYPLGWTVCEAWETRSSRKLRNTSPGKSSRPKVDRER